MTSEPIIIDATNDFAEESKRIYTDYAPALRSSRAGLLCVEPQEPYQRHNTHNKLPMVTNGDTKPIRVGTLFSGYDSQCLAMKRLGIPFELDFWCEIDRHAITAHNALFPQWKDRNLGDVSKVDWAEWHRQHPQPIDLLTYSSPCQDFSSAGLQRGGEEGSGTRSGLLWETERAVSELRPRHLVFENVGGLVSDKFIDLFQRWQARLNTYGYTNFQQLMNAKDYGCPQNRLRIFMVSILDCPRAYYFPKPFKLERRLKDVLEQNVEERYYLKEEQVAKLLATKEGYAVVPEGGVFDASYPDSTTRRGHVQEGGTVSPTIMASQNELLRYEGVAEPKVEVVGNLHPDSTWQGTTRQQDKIIGTSGISPCITELHSNHAFKIQETGIRIRRLSERELYRLMDVDEKDIDTLLAAPIPRTQHAKLAGNSIVVACLYYIFRNLFVDTEPAAGTQTKLF